MDQTKFELLFWKRILPARDRRVNKLTYQPLMITKELESQGRSLRTKTTSLPEEARTDIHLVTFKFGADEPNAADSFAF